MTDLRITVDLPAIGQAFAAAGYTTETLFTLFGAVSLPAPGSAEMGYFLHLTREPKPLHVFARLFLLGVEAPAAQIEPSFRDAAAAAGLLESRGDLAAATVRVQIYRGLLAASDFGSRGEDQVIGMTESTGTLADALIRRRSRATLDLGTGSGLLALLAAPHSGWVVATDLTARAAMFARFNAALNGVANIAVLQGDGFEPVRGRAFDHIVSNPPFAISPRVRLRYRDSGVAGDGFCRELIRGAPEYLNEGGFFQCLCDWIQPDGWEQRLAGWFEGSGCDAWVMRTESRTAADYARVWIRDSGGSFDEWMEYLVEARVPAVGSGLIVLHKRSGRNWIRIEDAPGYSGEFGGALELGFALRDWLDAASDETLLAEPLTLNPACRIDQRLEAGGGTWRVASAEVRLVSGLRYAGNVDRRAAHLLAGCDGATPLRELIVRLAAELGAPPERIAPDCLALMRRLIEPGYVVPQRLAAATTGASINP